MKSFVKKSPWQLEQSQRVTLRAAKGLWRWAVRCFAALSMTGRDRDSWNSSTVSP